MTAVAEMEPAVEMDEKLEFILSRDLRKAAKDLKPHEVRYLVDTYYQIQEYRKASANMVRSQEEEPNALLAWFASRMHRLEKQIPPAMKAYASGRLPGRWALSIHGIGPVIAAGLLAHFEIEQAPTVGHFWRFAGLDPTCKWEKGQKRPFSLRAKVLCWKIGQSFMKLRGYEADVYGKVYEQRKAFEIERNEAGFNKGKPHRTAGKSTTVDKLPPFRIDAQARRYAVKLFLAHLHHVMYVDRFKTDPPKPYILAHGGHTHFIAPPNWPVS